MNVIRNSSKPQNIIGLLRRHLGAVLVILLLFGAVGIYLKKSHAPYQDSGVVVFNEPPSSVFPNPYSSPSGTLIEAAGLVAILATSPAGDHQVRAAGGAAQYSVVLANSYNLEYPYYGSPTVRVTAAASDPVEATRTFTIVTRVIASDLTALQGRAGVPQAERITTAIVGVTGPLSQQGSSKRVFAGLLFLAIVAVFTVAGFLDRHSIRLRRKVSLSHLASWRAKDTGQQSTS